MSRARATHAPGLPCGIPSPGSRRQTVVGGLNPAREDTVLVAQPGELVSCLRCRRITRYTHVPAPAPYHAAPISIGESVAKHGTGGCPRCRMDLILFVVDVRLPRFSMYKGQSWKLPQSCYQDDGSIALGHGFTKGTFRIVERDHMRASHNGVLCPGNPTMEQAKDPCALNADPAFAREFARKIGGGS